MKPTVFCLPFGGGNSFAFRELGEYASDRLNVIALDLHIPELRVLLEF